MKQSEEKFLIYCKLRGSNDKFGPMDLHTGECRVDIQSATKFSSLEAAIVAVDKMADNNPEFLFQVRKARRSYPEYVPERCRP